MKLRSILGGAILALGLVPAAQADSIMKIGLSETNTPDVEYAGGVLSTVDDGDATTVGEQNTRIDFVGFLGFLSDVTTAAASFTLSGAQSTGNAVQNGLLISQTTTGGTFSLWDQSNNLLLSGLLAEGAIAGGADDTGAFFNTGIATYTAGSLLSFVAPTPAGISLALAGIFTNGQTGMFVTNGVLDPFVADASGIFAGKRGQEIPEPFTASLLLSGLVGGMGLKKRLSR